MAKKQTSITLDEDVIERIDKYAAQRKLSRSAAITQLILDVPLKRERKKKEDEQNIIKH